jgi:hypothetical protein
MAPLAVAANDPGAGTCKEHPEVPALGKCLTCGTLVCETCGGVVGNKGLYCINHTPAITSATGGSPGMNPMLGGPAFPGVLRSKELPAAPQSAGVGGPGGGAYGPAGPYGMPGMPGGDPYGGGGYGPPGAPNGPGGAAYGPPGGPPGVPPGSPK